MAKTPEKEPSSTLKPEARPKERPRSKEPIWSLRKVLPPSYQLWLGLALPLLLWPLSKLLTALFGKAPARRRTGSRTAKRTTGSRSSRS